MTGLQTHAGEQMKAAWESPEVKKAFKSTEQGAATTVLAALGKEYEGRGGCYLEDCNEAALQIEPGMGAPGHAPWAHDEEAEKKLWVDSCKMVGVSDED